MEFFETDIPAKSATSKGRPKLPNPYQPVIDAMALNIRTEEGTGRAFTFTIEPIDSGKGPETISRSVQKALNLIRKGAKEQDFSVAYTNDELTLTTWGIPRVTRTRKPKDTETVSTTISESPAETSDETPAEVPTEPKPRRNRRKNDAA